jgi:hypothetical protein
VNRSPISLPGLPVIIDYRRYLVDAIRRRPGDDRRRDELGTVAGCGGSVLVSLLTAAEAAAGQLNAEKELIQTPGPCQ